MARIDEDYKDILTKIIYNGYDYEDPNRSEVVRKEISSAQLTYNLKEGFPILTTKHVPFKSIVTELLWFLRGEPDIKFLLDNGCNIWNKDAYNFYLKMVPSSKISLEEFISKVSSNQIEGSVGNIYPVQWRNSGGVDQIQRIVDLMRDNPFRTDLIVNSWSTSELDKMALPPCHYSFQILGRPYYNNTKGFYLMWNQRSTDFFLGAPFNIASYALLAKILELLTGVKALGIIGNFNKVHLYDNQIEGALEQLNRDVYKYTAPDLEISLNNNRDLQKISVNEFLKLVDVSSFSLLGYNSFDSIKVSMLARDVG